MLSGQGAKLIITARNEKRLMETFTSLEGDSHKMVVSDLADINQISALVSSVNQIDGLVCNAGINKIVPINYINEDDLLEIFKINTFSAFMLIKALMRAKKMKANGSLVFVSSKASMQNSYGNSMYAASKAALASLARSCAIEYANKGIRANSVHPGMVETPLLNRLNLSEEAINKDKERYLLKRYASAEEIAWAIIYLLSDASSWTTGTSLVVDGGGRIVKE